MVAPGDKILIVGISSFLGVNLARALREKYRIFGTYYRNRVRLDGVVAMHLPLVPQAPIREVVQALRPQAILYLAGETDIGLCEREPGLFHAINAQFPEIVAAEAADVGAEFYFFSSPYVFGGTQGPYSENDLTAPKTLFGQMKAEAERTLNAYPSLILRLGHVFGLHYFRKRTFFQNICESLYTHTPVPMVSDELRSFLSIEECIRCIEFLLENPTSAKILHLGSGRMSYYEFAVLLGDVVEVPVERWVPISASSLPGRPPGVEDISLNTLEMNRLLPSPILSVKVQIEQTILNLRRGRY